MGGVLSGRFGLAHRLRRPLAFFDHLGFLERLWGFGSVYAKTLRDSRLATLGVAALVSLTLVAGGSAMSSAYGTPQTRTQMADYASQIPSALVGVYGKPVNVDTLGGFVSWHYAGLFALITGLWCVLALSATLASDVRRGSLEFVLASPMTRRAVALQKLAAHLTALTAAMVIVAASAWLTGLVFGTMPGDGISPPAALAFALRLGLMALLAGSIAFAIAPFLGNRSAAGVAGSIMLGSYVIHGWETAIPAFRSIAGLTWFSWAENHIPLAGSYDWPSQIALAIAAAVLLAIGVEGFVRRDILPANGISLPHSPRRLLGLGGPGARSFGELLPTSLAWGLGLAAFGFVMAAASRSFAEGIRDSPDILKVVQQFFPAMDITSPGWFLEMAFTEFGFVLVGLAAATFVAGWASDETSGRLEMLLATPLTRARFALCGGIASCLAVCLATLLLAGAIGLGAAVAGGDATTPAIGTAALGIYGMALAGIGCALGAIGRPSWAGPGVALFALATFLVDFLVPALNWPDWVHQLSLSAHVGQPMIGAWDGPGMATCLAIAVVGIVVAGAAMRRRDVNA
jgi:polyether ionophore transport system permease protein